MVMCCTSCLLSPRGRWKRGMLNLKDRPHYYGFLPHMTTRSNHKRGPGKWPETVLPGSTAMRKLRPIHYKVGDTAIAIHDEEVFALVSRNSSRWGAPTPGIHTRQGTSNGVGEHIAYCSKCRPVWSLHISRTKHTMCLRMRFVLQEGVSRACERMVLVVQKRTGLTSSLRTDDVTDRALYETELSLSILCCSLSPMPWNVDASADTRARKQLPSGRPTVYASRAFNAEPAMPSFRQEREPVIDGARLSAKVLVDARASSHTNTLMVPM